jgi:hypothetical protein
MAERPVFLPRTGGPGLVRTVPVAFVWHPGLSAAQKKRNVAALHAAAAEQGIAPLLEISSKSEETAGQALSAFRLPLTVEGAESTVECAFQGSKVFQRGGPFTDLYAAGSRAAKRDPRLRDSGRLTGFRFEGRDYPLTPPTAFYDWLYINALWRAGEWHDAIARHAGFTDIEFNPRRAINCQAHACAAFVALKGRGVLEEAVASFEGFAEVLKGNG